MSVNRVWLDGFVVGIVIMLVLFFSLPSGFLRLVAERQEEFLAWCVANGGCGPICWGC